MRYNVPVDFTVEADSLDKLQEHFTQFMRMACREFALQYQIIDWELPTGYPVEEVKPVQKKVGCPCHDCSCS